MIKDTHAWIEPGVRCVWTRVVSGYGMSYSVEGTVIKRTPARVRVKLDTGRTVYVAPKSLALTKVEP